MTYLIGITGSVASGKSFFARQFCSPTESGRSSAQRYINFPLTKSTSIQVVSTDGFLYTTKELTQMGTISEKGAPHTHRTEYLRQVLTKLKNGQSAQVPLYSHEKYDPYGEMTVNADVVVVEGVGLNDILDLLDELIFIDTPIEVAHQRYIDRKIELGVRDEVIEDMWVKVNLANYEKYILPLKKLADAVVSDV